MQPNVMHMRLQMYQMCACVCVCVCIGKRRVSHPWLRFIVEVFFWGPDVYWLCGGSMFHLVPLGTAIVRLILPTYALHIVACCTSMQ